MLVENVTYGINKMIVLSIVFVEKFKKKKKRKIFLFVIFLFGPSGKYFGENMVFSYLDEE